MSPRVIIFYIIVVIFPVFGSSVIRGVNVYYINRFVMSKIQNRERVIVVALDKQIYRLAFIAVYFFIFSFFQNRKRLTRHFIGKHFAGRASVRINKNIDFLFR